MNGTKPLRFLNEDLADLKAYTFAVIVTRYQNQWVFVRHRDRQSWELPAGHVDPGETVYEAAHRELFEETGAAEYQLERLTSYQGIYKDKTVFGMLFLAHVLRFVDPPETEIAEKKFFTTIPNNLTYPLIQPQLINFYLKV